MIQMLGQVVLSVVLIVWGYQVASRVGRHPVWLWPGIGAAVVFGFLALTAVYVAEGAAASIRNVAALVASVLYAIVVVLVVALFVVVSRAATRPVQAVPETAPPRSMWEPKDEEHVPVIVDDEPLHPGGVIDAGTAPRRAARAYDDTLENKFVAPQEPVVPEPTDEPGPEPGSVHESAPESTPGSVSAPEPMFVPPPEPVADDEPAAPLPVRGAEASADAEDDDEAWELIKPRRAMSAEPDPGDRDES